MQEAFFLILRLPGNKRRMEKLLKLAPDEYNRGRSFYYISEVDGKKRENKKMCSY
jgi:hypothetical protein